MARVLTFLACAAALAITGCGGEGATKTVTQVKTVTAAATTPEPDATGTSGESGPSGPTETAPTEPLPTETNGATAVQGTYAMKVTKSQIGAPNRDKELTWSAVTTCSDTCTVALQRENDNGGFKALKLEQTSTSRYGADSTGTTDYCVTDGIRPTKDRTSLSVQKQRDEGGVPLATEIEGFVKIVFHCSSDSPQMQITYRLRGRLKE